MYFYGIGEEGITVSWTNLMIVEGDQTSGATPAYSSYFPGLKNAYFQGLRSTGRNLLKLNDGQYTVFGVSVNISNGQVTFSGTATNSGGRTIWLSDGFVLPAGTYFISCTPALDFSKCIGYITNKNDVSDTLGSTAAGVFTLDKATEVGFGINFLSAGEEYIGTYSFMLNRGSSALPYEPYISHELSLDTAIELPAWDSINPTTGKKIVQSNTLTFDGTELWGYVAVSENISRFYISFNAPNNTESICNLFERVETYSNLTNGTYIIYGNTLSIRDDNFTDVNAWKAQLAAWNTAGDPLTVCYQTATPTESDIEMEDRLPAYKNGSETVIQGDTDNSEYGAENTLTQNYAEVKGTTEGGNS